MSKYARLSDGRTAKVEGGNLFVKQTNMRNGMLESGGHADRIVSIPYKGTLNDAMKQNDYGISDIDRAIENPSRIVRQGRKIF